MLKIVATAMEISTIPPSPLIMPGSRILVCSSVKLRIQQGPQTAVQSRSLYQEVSNDLLLCFPDCQECLSFNNVNGFCILLFLKH